MPTVVPVKFKYASRDLWFDPGDTGVVEADHAICHTERGLEIGIATADPREVGAEELHDAVGDAPLRMVERVATDDDLRRAEELADKGDAALPVFREAVHASGLDMKPVGVEYPFGGDRVVCYFSAEERVDFRKLVRDLAHELHEHVDMRQIGVREEAAIIGGWGHCGQELCCARFGHQFEPVSIRMAKEQDLPLNSSKISGACGRLMCCLRYEFEAYRDFKQRAPKRNAVISTPLGKAKIVEYDTPKEQLALRLENGKVVRIPLSGMVASDAAKKKSQDLGCPCRPDTVTRDALERLNSPDVQMALAEVDRANGVIPPEPAFHESDIFVDTAPKRRKRHRSEGGTAGEGGQARKRDGSQQPAPRHRRHRGAPQGGGAEAEGARQQQARHAAPSQPAQDASQAPARRRRRRHHEASGEVMGSQQGRDARQGQASAASGGQASQNGHDGAQHAARRHRHPGDRGGRPQGSDAHRGGQQPRSRQQGQAGGPKAASGSGSRRQQERQDGGARRTDGAPRRRHHRRGPEGGSHGAGQGQGAPKGE